MNGIKKILLIIHTLRYLKFRQIFYQVYYRFRKSLKLGNVKVPKFPENVGTLILEDYIYKPESYSKNAFTFLNLKKEYSSIHSIQWDEPVFGKLWAYNLNYFDFLHQPNMDADTGNQLIEDFIGKYNTLLNAGEPYTISLRGINWIKWISRPEQKNHRHNQQIITSLWLQYQTLAKNIEYHLLGNHLLENAFSLLFGAFYFGDQKLYAKAKKILIEELNEQTLPDGAHFELSPMYHQIILDRVLDCINLLKNNNRFPDQNDLLEAFKNKAGLMQGWLESISFTGGEIPMVNDSAKGIAPQTKELTSYAQRLGVNTIPCKLRESGYRMFRFPAYEMVVDYGAPGPTYIPGHAHADLFNFVLNVHGEPIITEVGISTYNTCETRLRERSTASHNTVKVNNSEQSEVWSSFRMGRRVKPKILLDKSDKIVGKYKGLSHYSHERAFFFSEKSIKINDVVSGDIKNSEAFIHFAPGLTMNIKDQIISIPNGKIIISGAKTIHLEDYSFAEGFNRLVKAPIVRIVFENFLECCIEINSEL